MLVAMLFHRLGPYHVARFRALAKRGEVVAIELSGKDNTYAWESINTGSAEFKRFTVFPDIDVDDVPWQKMRDQLWATLEKVKPSVLLIPSWGTNYSIAALQWCLRTGTKRVVFSESAENDKVRRWHSEIVKKIIVSNYQVAFVGGTRQAAYIRRLGIAVDRIFTGYASIDNEYFQRGATVARNNATEGRRTLALPDKYFLTACRFIPKKNLSTLLFAFQSYLRMVRSGVEPTHLVLIGDGALRSQLESQSINLGISGLVHFLGFKQYEETPAYFGLSVAFVLPSVEEQWGLVVNEALSAGVPVIVSKQCNCVPDLVHDGKSGYVFDAKDVAELAKVLLKTSELTTSQKASMVSFGQELVARFSTDNFAENVFQAADLAYKLPNRGSVFSGLALGSLVRRKNVVDY